MKSDGPILPGADDWWALGKFWFHHLLEGKQRFGMLTRLMGASLRGLAAAAAVCGVAAMRPGLDRPGEGHLN